MCSKTCKYQVLDVTVLVREFAKHITSHNVASANSSKLWKFKVLSSSVYSIADFTFKVIVSSIIGENVFGWTRVGRTRHRVLEDD
jgi:hypothetical protein